MRADESGLPIHGALAAAADWDVTDAGADDGAAWLGAALDYGRRDDRLAVFPFPHRLELALRLEGDALTVATGVEPTAEDPVPLAFGWHPWLSLPGVPARGVGARPARARASSPSTPASSRRASAPRRRRSARRWATACSTTTRGWRRTRATRCRAAAARSPSSGRAASRSAQVFALAELDAACLEPMMAPVAALSTGEALWLAYPGEPVRATFRVRVG